MLLYELFLVEAIVLIELHLFLFPLDLPLLFAFRELRAAYGSLLNRAHRWVQVR